MPLEIAGVSIFIACLAGLLSVASPCVLPLVPGYLGYLTGASSLKTPEGNNSLYNQGSVPFLHSLSFVLGFSLMFILFGVSLGIIGFFLHEHQDIILKVSGSLLILLGLHLSGIINISWLQREWKLNFVKNQKISYTRSFLVGSAFSAGWSPCIGPTLGAILALAVSTATILEATLLLIAYSTGLAVPFLIMGLAFNKVQPLYLKIKSHIYLVNYISGALLIIVGILIFTDSLIDLNSLFNIPFLRDLSLE